MSILNKRKIYTIYLLAVIIGLSGCKSKQTLVESGELKSKSHNQVLKDEQGSEIQFKNLTGKVNFALVLPGGPKNTKKVGGVVKLIKDEVFQVSFRMFGIEGFRMTATPDSIYIIDRMNKNYAVENIKNIQKDFNFNFYNMQALFTNALFVPGQKALDKNDYSKFKLNKGVDTYMASISSNNTLYSFAIDANDRIASTVIYKGEGEAIQWSYQKFIIDNKRVYPTEMQTQIEYGDKRFNFNISYDKLDFDTDLNIDYSLPTKYTKMTIKQIMKSYIK